MRGIRMAELANCVRCEALFVKSIRQICQSCYQEEETAFKVVYHFLCDQKNREATMDEIIDATGIEEAIIIKFIKEGRLRASQFPNLAYACEKCGTNIVTGKICNDCAEQLKRELGQHEEILTKSQKNSLSNTKQTKIYYSVKQK